ncbi:polyprenyl synthetase family protein [Paenibacillus psychroresistens]|uniref:Farnesyl diphosphate synthase n=1 Tax=Paenibacillus psychroresistens TaxID=1778678 RepID=A0A6B8RP52_9BACL|nr:farnesyl diphosphate synthase [Paenibacillus psychroresistens]QGQ97098.1 polyprenyl synthetase family protein [Paenibacillus psychroresistens]
MGSQLTIAQYVREHAAKVEQELGQAIPASWDIPGALRDAMQYSLMAGGKRLRPILVIAAAEALGGTIDAAMPIACAIEMIHTYSLIHDDLPAMDNDDLRRGKPTNHKVFGEAMAILAGDALLTQAFYQATQVLRIAPILPEQALKIIEELAILAGAMGMVGGQAADTLGEQGITRIEELDYIHRHKTGDIIVFSLRAGGRVANATDQQLLALENFGYKIGLAFQIQDDILDIIGDESKLGKPVKSDEKQQKVTYPYLLGIAPSQEKVRQLTEEAKSAIIAAGFINPERLLQLADYLVDRDS